MLNYKNLNGCLRYTLEHKVSESAPNYTIDLCAKPLQYRNLFRSILLPHLFVHSQQTLSSPELYPAFCDVWWNCSISMLPLVSIVLPDMCFLSEIPKHHKYLFSVHHPFVRECTLLLITNRARKSYKLPQLAAQIEGRTHWGSYMINKESEEIIIASFILLINLPLIKSLLCAKIGLRFIVSGWTLIINNHSSYSICISYC